MNKEQIYDEQINPLMAQIIDICKANQINLHATFFLGAKETPSGESDGDLTVTTHLAIDRPTPVALRLMYYASKAGDNFDSFIFAVMRDARETGHSSVALDMLGLPAKRV